jgi:hypothetical protein
MRLLAALLLALAALPGCRLISGEVACERDRDCPGSVRFCQVSDAGVGLCVEEDPDPEPLNTDAGFDIPFPDAGAPAPDAGDAG